MGFAVVHMQKIKAGGVRGIQIHNNRERSSHTNPDINIGKSDENYHLIHSDNYSRDIKASIEFFASETKTVRKDAVVYCSFVVTSDEQTMKAMSLEQQKAFFNDSVQWFARRYGGENIVNATVHMDETTPHMHLGIVPITDNRLTAKKLFDRKELTAIQTDFAKQVGERYGLKRGIEGSERTHLSETRFKLQQAEKKLEHVLSEYERIRTVAEEIGHKGKEEVVKLKALQNESDALKGQIEALQADLRARQMNIRDILAIKPERGLMGSVKGVTISDIENLKATAIKGLEAREGLSKLSSENQRLKKLVPSIQEQIQQAKKNHRLEELEKEFNRLPSEVQKQYLQGRTQEKSPGRER